MLVQVSLELSMFPHSLALPSLLSPSLLIPLPPPHHFFLFIVPLFYTHSLEWFPFPSHIHLLFLSSIVTINKTLKPKDQEIGCVYKKEHRAFICLAGYALPHPVQYFPVPFIYFPISLFIFFLYSLINFYCVYLHFYYLFITYQTSRLFLFPSHCAQSSNKHGEQVYLQQHTKSFKYKSKQPGHMVDLLLAF